MVDTNGYSLPVSLPEPVAEESQVPTISLEGETLGKYRVLEPLGRGGMARVYRAYHPQLDRYVAIKVLRSDLAEDEAFLSRFRREAQAVASLRHPNVVQVFDADVEEETYYIVLELLEGDTLKRRLNDYRTRGEKMPLGEMVRILLDVLDGVAYAHSEGMIHRDLKPANIMLTQSGQAVVTDFGIAQIIGSTQHTASGALMGTLNYMAPEQGLEGRSDARSDVYSLGIVLYELLTQRTPFEADTPLAVLMKHVNDPLPLPRKMDPTIPEPFERIVLKALAKDPDSRYQSAEEMSHALQMATEEAGIELPARVSQAFSFTTSEVPSESVAVFSGTSRERITDAGFADMDTDARLGQRLADDEARDLRGAGKAFMSALGGVMSVALDKATGAMNERSGALRKDKAQWPPSVEDDSAPQPEAGPADAASEEFFTPHSAARARMQDSRERRMEYRRRRKMEREAARPRRRGVGFAVLGTLGLVAFGNLVMITIATPANAWWVFELGWPIEIFLVSWGLCLIMYTASSIWLLIPTGLTLGTGALLAYTALTGEWDRWNYLWLVEVWVAALSILIPIWFARYTVLARGMSRLLALLLSFGAIAGIYLVGITLGMDRLFVDLYQLLMP